MEKIIIHPLEVWQDPQCNCITEFIRDEMFYYFKCWDSLNDEIKEADYLGLIHLKGVWAVNYQRFRKTSYYPIDIENDYRGYYYEIANSEWVTNLKNERSKFDKEWSYFDKREYTHFVLENNEGWVEVVAVEIKFSKIKMDKSKLKLWDKV
jgi:hypothetical protein